MKIYKYAIELGVQTVRVPQGAKFISAGLDGLGAAVVWALVDDRTNVSEGRDVLLTGTGSAFDVGCLEFVGTFVQGPFVWHVFAQQPEGSK